MILKLIFKSLQTRWFSTLLTVISIGLSVALLLGVERAREGARNSFTESVSGVNLIVGKKGGSLNLLLYTVFRLGSPTENLSYETFEKISKNDAIDYVIPYSLGDSYKGYRVVGTDESFFKYFQYGDKRNLKFARGRGFKDVFDVVLGSSVSEETKHRLGKKIILAHGDDVGQFQKHDNSPFKVVGTLRPTGTPVDRSVYISLKGMTAMHVGWDSGAFSAAAKVKPTDDVLVEEITAFFVKTKSPFATLGLQRYLNQYEEEPLTAIIPGIVLSELWQSLSYVETTLKWISLLVVIVGLVTMLIAIYNTLSERRREMAILRSIGASASTIFSIMMLESLILTLAGILLGIIIIGFATVFLGPSLVENFGLSEAYLRSAEKEKYYILFIFGMGALLGFIPAIKAYFNTVADGLTIKS